jgi:hypothetical protein
VQPLFFFSLSTNCQPAWQFVNFSPLPGFPEGAY